MSPEVWTIGHSTRTLEAFAEALSSFRIDHVADIRRFPHSRRNPQYNTDELKKGLFRGGMAYEFLGDELGGFRKPKAESKHVCLSGSGFQGYADHLESTLFHKGLTQMLALTSRARLAYMCAERQPKDCHRKILSDLLATKGWKVHHILDAGNAFDHELTPTVRLVEGKLLYAPKALGEFQA